MSGFKLVEPGRAQAWWWPGCVVRLLAAGEDTGGRYVLREEVVPPGAGPMAHVQHRTSEGIYVRDGGPLQLRAGDRTHSLGPGSFARIATGTAHRLENGGEGDARILRWCFPAGFDRFLFAAGKEIDDPDDPPETTEADRQHVRDLAPEFGIEMEPDDEDFTKPADIAIAQSGEGATTPIAGNLWTTFAEAEGFAMYDVAVAPGEGASAIQHEGVDIGCYVVGGTIRLDVDDRPVEARAGAFVHLPAGTRLRLLAAGEQPARALLWATPAADLLTLAGAP